jgi:hypothetical protein
MRTATGISLIAIGAILAFAVTRNLPFLNLQIAGWVLIVCGVLGMVIPRRGYGWLRRRVVLRRPSRQWPSAGPGTWRRYLMLPPGPGPSPAVPSEGTGFPDYPAGQEYEEERAGASTGARPAEEVVEEFREGDG